MRILRNHLQNALESLGANRMRTFLTMLGVMIGIASITIIFALSGGLGKMITEQVSANSHGGAIAVVRPKEIGINDKNFISSMATSRTFTKSSLTEQDVESISKTKGVVATAPMMSFSGEIRAGKNNFQAGVLATSPDIEKIVNLKLKDGQFIGATAGTNNTVIGQQLAVNLFGTSQAIGQNIYIKNQPFLVVGILERQESPINYNNINFDETAIVNFVSGKNLNQNSVQIQQINVKVDSVNNLESTENKIDLKLLENHKDERDFDVLSGDRISHPTGQFIDVMATVLAIVASISLLVGGIGIMNIMLVNVSERTREIGIRKALGANNAQILLQFLTESLIISIGGGFFGYVAGYSFSFGLSTFLPFSPLFSWQIAALVGGISLFVGVLFGVYPALRASRKDPIESLRHYN